jgi:carbonic anhydrase
MVRNIGNQLATAEGSVEYGVHHLHTPLLIFVGHSSCGAIKAASGDYRKESKTIRRELDTIKIPKGGENLAGVKLNVNNQVAGAMKKFAHEVKDGHLTVIGAVYDFSNEFGKGYGRLNIINLNGETDSARIASSRLLSDAIEAKPVVSQKAGAIRTTVKPQATTTGSSDPHPYSYP